MTHSTIAMHFLRFQVVQKEMEVTMGFPQAKRACEMHVVTIPEIQCEDIVESKCQDMPHITETPESIERYKHTNVQSISLTKADV